MKKITDKNKKIFIKCLGIIVQPTTLFLPVSGVQLLAQGAIYAVSDKLIDSDKPIPDIDTVLSATKENIKKDAILILDQFDNKRELFEDLKLDTDKIAKRITDQWYKDRIGQYSDSDKQEIEVAILYYLNEVQRWELSNTAFLQRVLRDNSNRIGDLENRVEKTESAIQTIREQNIQLSNDGCGKNGSDIVLTVDGRNTKDCYLPFYNYVSEQFYGESKNELYGDVPLRDFYIETTVNVKDEDGDNLRVRKFIELWLKRDGFIAVICGEPGHGKTSLCQKAMCDFMEEGWLFRIVSNIFCFSLNPANTDALANDDFYLYSLLSWGDDRKSPDQKINKKDLENALIFLDGFDELLEWHPRFGLKDFIRDYIVPFQRDSKAHVIITSRSMAVEPNIDAYAFENGIRVPIIRLQLITRDDQIKWIKKCIDYYKSIILKESMTQNKKENLKLAKEELDEYLKDYIQFSNNSDLQNILGIPIIFRMIVNARYKPQSNQSITQLYDNLFHETWMRHRHIKKDILIDQEKETKKKLSLHSLSIYADNNDTAVVNNLFEPFWLFSFYTTHRGEKRVGFWHRSFYQYFLANEILSWFRDYETGEDDISFMDRLSVLSRRRLDESTLAYIEDIYALTQNKEHFVISISKAYKTLKETDGILPLPNDSKFAESMKSIMPLKRANNAFWNIVSISSICGQMVSVNDTSIRAFQTYNLEGCVLLNARLIKVNLNQAKLGGAIFRGADFSEASLVRAYLSGADLKKAKFIKAHVESSDFSGANLSETSCNEALFREADLSGTDLREADLSGADLERSNLNRSNLEGAILKGAKLNRAILNIANLERADLSGAILNKADLIRVNLVNAKLNGIEAKKANFSRADLGEAELCKADFYGSDFNGANFSGTNISKSNFIRANLAKANLSEAILNGANLIEADLREVILIKAKLIGANFIDADLRGADLRESNLNGAKLSGANFRGANLSKSEFSGANFSRANLKGIDLRKENLSGTDLRGANLSGAMLSNANLSGSDISGANLSGANLSEAFLTGAKFVGANLVGANLEEANLSKVDLSGADLSNTNLKGISHQDIVLLKTKINKSNAEYLKMLGCDISKVIILNDLMDESKPN